MNDSLLLECLFEVGVDNWDGYKQAIALYHQREEEMQHYNQTNGFGEG